MTNADRDRVAMLRGQALVACDTARSLAVQAHELEHSLEDEWMKQRAERAKPWWRFW